MFIRNSIRHLHPTDVAGTQRAPSTARRGATRAAPPLVTVHTWVHPQLWECGHPRRHRHCHDPCCSTTLGARASRPYRVSEGKMPRRHHRVPVHTWDHPQTWERGRPARTASPRARCPRSRRHHLSEGKMPSLQETWNTYPRCCVSTWQYAIMRRLNECEARHRNGI